MTSYQIEFTEQEATFCCLVNENVLSASQQLRINGLKVGCRSGGCGVCKIQVLSGEFSVSGPMSRAQVTMEDEAQGIVLACKTVPQSDLKVRILDLK